MAAPLPKTVTVSIDANGQVTVKADPTLGHTHLPITITREPDGQQVLHQDLDTDPQASHTNVTLTQHVPVPGKYTVDVECSGSTYTQVINVPASGVLNVQLILAPAPV